MRLAPVLAMMLLPASVAAADLKVEKAMVPLAPPTAKVHAAFMMLKNEGTTPAQIIGVSADGYAMAHLHESTVKDGVASMKPVHMIEVAPGQSVMLEHGGLHVMLMKPEAPAQEGDAVTFSLELADGTSVPVTAKVMKQMHSHGHGS